MSRLFFFLLCAAVFLSSASLHAGMLTLDEALREGLAASPAVGRAAEALTQARLNLKAAYSGFLPQVSASASTDQSGSDSSALSRQYSLGLSGSWQLFSGFSDVNTVRARTRALEAAEAEYDRARADTAYQVRAAFYELASSQESLTLSSEILKRRTQNRDMIQLKYEAGGEDRGSLLRVEADRAQSQFEENKARRSVAAAVVRLARALGRSSAAGDFGPASLESASPQVPADTDALIPAVPEYRLAIAAREQARSALGSSYSGFMPELNLSGSAGRSGAEWMPDAQSWRLGISLSYPLFSGGRTVFAVGVARAGLRSSEAAVRHAALRLSTALALSANSVADAFEDLKVRDGYRSAAAAQAEVTRAKYINGLTTYQDWYVIENDAISAERSLLSARRAAAIAAAQWLSDMGRVE